MLLWLKTGNFKRHEAKLNAHRKAWVLVCFVFWVFPYLSHERLVSHADFFMNISPGDRLYFLNMLSSLENTAPLESFSIAKIRSLIKYNIERIFADEFLSNPFVRLYLERECEGPLLDYVNLVSFYLVSPQTEGYDESVRIFLKKYEAFMETYKTALSKNGVNRPVCAGIAIIWLRVIEYMDGQAQKAGDMLLRSVAMQLDRDMMYVIEKLFPSDNQ